MQKPFLKLLLSQPDFVLRLWVALWERSDNGKTVTSLTLLETEFLSYKNHIRRALYIDPEMKFTIIRKIKDPDSARHNAELLEIEFLPDPHDAVLAHYAELPATDIDLAIASKVSQAKPTHWIIEYILQNLPNVLKIKKQPSPEECFKLEKMYPEELITQKLKMLENYKKGRKVCHQLYTTVYYTIDEWCKREKPQNRNGKEVPPHRKAGAEALILFSEEFEKQAETTTLRRRK